MTDRLVGRGAVLRDATDALTHGPLVLRGLPGIGKSAVLAALLVERPAAISLYAVAALSSVPYLPVRLAELRLDGEGSPATLADRLTSRLPPDALIAVEDLHWCDVDTLALVEELAYRRPLVATVRTAAGPADEVVAAIAAHGQVIDVVGLDDVQSAALVRSIRPSATSEDVSRWVEAGKGNPLDLYLLATDRAQGPDGVDRAALAVAALDRVDVDLLARLAISAKPLALDAATVAELSRHGLVVESEPGRWQPRHHLIGGAAVAAVGEDRRREIHADQAAAHADPGVRAVHLAAAGQSAAAAAAAARAAADAPTLASRAEFLRLEAESTQPPSAAISRVAANALSLTGRYAEALALLDALPPDAATPETALVRARSHWAISEIDQARTAIADGLAACGADDGDVAAELHALRSRILCRVDWDLPGAIAAAEEGLALASGPGQGLLSARSARGLALLIAGDPSWPEELEAAGRLAVAEEDLHNAVVLYDTTLFGHLLSGDASRCRGLAAEAIAATEHTSAAWNGYFRAVSLLPAIHVDGDHATVLAESEVLSRRRLTVKAKEAVRTSRVFALLDAGRDLDAMDLAEEALADASDDSARATGSWALAETAWIAGEADRAIEVATASLELGMAGFPSCVNAALIGQWARIHLALPADERFTAATATGLANFAGAALECAGVGHLIDRPDQAVEEFEAAAAAWRGNGVRSYLRATIGASLAANRIGQAERAERHLRLLEREGARLDIAWLRRRVATELRRQHLSPVVAVPRSTVGAEVLERVARGQVTQAISRSLQVAPATIESHIRLAMRRSGARTRLQAAVMARAAAAAAGSTLRTVPQPCGATLIHSGSAPAGTPRVAVAALATGPACAVPVLVAGPIDDDDAATAVVLAAARGALLEVTVPANRAPSLTALLAALAQVGRPVDPPAAGAVPLEPEDRAIVSLLVAGATVTEAAATLGYSRRTVQRRLAALRAATGASTNREAVLLATAGP